MAAPGPVAERLARGVGARLFSGFWLQPILTAAVVLDLAAGALVLRFASPAALLGVLPALALLLGLWGCGVTASARVDPGGLRWRYFRLHAHEWRAVEQVRFGSVLVYGSQVARARPAILVRAGGVEHPVVPAYGVSPQHLARFADALSAQAAAHRVPAVVTAPMWVGIAALPGSVAGPRLAPGRVVSVSLQRLRLRLTGLALVVVAVLGFVGAFTGWESHGTGERVVFGIVGLVLGLSGLLLLVQPGAG